MAKDIDTINNRLYSTMCVKVINICTYLFIYMHIFKTVILLGIYSKKIISQNIKIKLIHGRTIYLVL